MHEFNYPLWFSNPRFVASSIPLSEESLSNPSDILSSEGTAEPESGADFYSFPQTRYENLRNNSKAEQLFSSRDRFTESLDQFSSKQVGDYFPLFFGICLFGIAVIFILHSGSVRNEQIEKDDSISKTKISPFVGIIFAALILFLWGVLILIPYKTSEESVGYDFGTLILTEPNTLLPGLLCAFLPLTVIAIYNFLNAYHQAQISHGKNSSSPTAIGFAIIGAIFTPIGAILAPISHGINIWNSVENSVSTRHLKVPSHNSIKLDDPKKEKFHQPNESTGPAPTN